MDLPERLWRFVADPDDVPLEEALLAIAQCRPGALPDVEPLRAHLDALASSVAEPDARAVCAGLFGPAGFRGDATDYYDPRNSLIDVVVERRIGMPITLSVVVIAVARRLGVTIEAIGAPGHFLVHDPGAAEYRDPFNGGMVVDPAALRAAVARVAPGADQPERLLAPVGPFAIVSRVLNNLQNSYASRDVRQLDWVLDVRLALPDSLHGDPRVLAGLCERRGRFDDAASILSRLGERLDDDGLRYRAAGLTARLN